MVWFIENEPQDLLAEARLQMEKRLTSKRIKNELNSVNETLPNQIRFLKTEECLGFQNTNVFPVLTSTHKIRWKLLNISQRNSTQSSRMRVSTLFMLFVATLLVTFSQAASPLEAQVLAAKLPADGAHAKTGTRHWPYVRP